MSASLERVLVDFVAAIERVGIEYALVGGIAVLSWGDPRTTRDIDVIARLEVTELQALHDALESNGFAFDREGASTAIREGSHFTIFHEDGFYHVDLVPANRPSHEWTLEGRRRVELEDQVCWLASPEDTIANKLVFGSEQDLQDAAGIIARIGEDLDEARLEQLCERLGVLQDLKTLRTRVDQSRD